MTKKIKNVKLLLYICLAMFLLNSCTEEKEYLENNNRDLKFEQKSFKELILLKDFNNAYQRVKTEKQKNVASRSALEEQYDFTIKESEDVKIVEVDNKKFYNILIERDSASASYFENLVFMVEKINNQDEISAYILKYGTPDGYMQFDYNGDKEITPLFERISMYCYKVCVTQCHDLREGTMYAEPHAPGAGCNNQELIVTNCYSTCDSTAGTQYGMGGTFTVSNLTTGTTQITGSGSNDSTEIVTAPVYGGTLSDVTSKSPCGQMNLASQDQTFKDNLIYLKENTGLDHEVGIFQIPPSPTQIQNQYSIVNGTSDGNDIPAVITGQITAYMHTHYDVDTQLSVFSLADIKTIYDLIIAENIKKPKAFTAVLVTAHGTKYALKITDVYNFKTFCQSYFNGWENPSVEKIIEDKHELLNNIRIKNSNSVNEESFAKFLSKNNVGMSFLKCTNDNFTEWSEIVVQSNGLVESYPCNN